MTIRDAYDVAVVGAGPAGLAAATLAARAGLATVLFDEQPAAGGQIYRAAGITPLRAGSVLGDDYWRGRGLIEAFAASGAQHVPGATVWSLSREREIGVTHGGAARIVRATRVILATGAIERPFPIPGWTMPGVMTVGAAQILLKTAGLKPDGKVWIERKGGSWSPEEEASFKRPTIEMFERQSHPLYASARLWDDGIIDPRRSREALALSLSATLNAPIPPTRFGLFRM